VEINTSCKGCVFELDGPGCKLGRLELFRRTAPVEIQEGHALIKGRVCTTCRNRDSEWARATPPEQYAEAVRQQVRVRYEAVVPVEQGDSADMVAAAVAGLARQRPAPLKVHVALLPNTLTPAQVIPRLRALGGDLEWAVLSVLPAGPAGHATEVHNAIDQAVKAMPPTTAFYVVFRPGFEAPAQFAAELDAALNDRLERFLVLTPASREFGDQGLVVSVAMHGRVGGNAAATHHTADGLTIACDAVEDKVLQMAIDDDSRHLVKCVEDVCPSMRN
jgi:hypothetical protein